MASYLIVQNTALQSDNIFENKIVASIVTVSQEPKIGK